MEERVRVMAGQERTLWVPGRPGWQGQQGSVAGLVVIGVLLGCAALAVAVLWITDPAPAVKALGLSLLLLVAVTAWMLVVHLRVGRVRVVRVDVDGGRVIFGAARQVAAPTRLLALVGLVLLASWIWAIFTAPADSLPIVTLLGVPVIAAALIFGGVRAWFRGTGSHSLSLTPDRLTLRIPGNSLDVAWDDVVGAELSANRVHVTAGGAAVSFAARDLASDPVILAELIAFYARNPRARSAIGTDTARRLSSGDF